MDALGARHSNHVFDTRSAYAMDILAPGNASDR
jgi:hypothetical protein